MQKIRMHHATTRQAQVVLRRQQHQKHYHLRIAASIKLFYSTTDQQYVINAESEHQQQQQQSTSKINFDKSIIEKLRTEAKSLWTKKRAPTSTTATTSSTTTERRQPVPYGFWKDPQNRRNFFDKLARDNGINHPDDWFDSSNKNVSVKQLIAATKGALKVILNEYYSNSLLRALKDLYPEHDWSKHERERQRAPYRQWKDLARQREFFDNLGRELGVQTLDDWYKVKVEDARSRGGRGIINGYYNGSLMRALRAIYPEHPWDEDEQAQTRSRSRVRVPKKFWKDPANHRLFFEEAAAKLNVKQPSDWYNVSNDDIVSLGGGGLLGEYYNSSLFQALQAVYPEYQLLPEKFQRTPVNHWRSLENHRRFFDNLAKELGITRVPDDWYSVTTREVQMRGGNALLGKYYNSSLSRALRTVYPEHDWQSWRFRRVSGSGRRGDDGLLRDVMASLSKQLCINHLDDWYRVSRDQIAEHGGYSIIERNGGLYLVLKRLHPEHPWDELKFSNSSKKSSQRWLVMSIRRIFPHAEIAEDYLHPDMHFLKTHQRMELDVYLPSLSLAFEYHGKQHYKDVFFFGPTAKYRGQDSEKASACARLGIALIDIPYWWDRKAESLAATIKQVRPDLAIPDEILAGAEPIATEPPAAAAAAAAVN